MSETESAINFETFILSLGTAVMISLGEIENPVTKQKEKNLDAAKQNIDLLDLLKEKTQNNLTERESKLLESVLYETRVKFVAQK